MFKSTSSHKKRILKVVAVAGVGLAATIAIFKSANSTEAPVTTLAQTNYQCTGVDTFQFNQMLGYLDTLDPQGSQRGYYSFDKLRPIFGQVTDQQLNMIKRMFDQNNNGVLDVSEWCTMTQYSQTGLLSMFKSYTDKATVLHHGQDHICNDGGLETAQQVDDWFIPIDADWNGYITVQELATAYNLSNASAEEILEQMETSNVDQGLSYQEACTAFYNKGE